jgi:hypothetical protein
MNYLSNEEIDKCSDSELNEYIDICINHTRKNIRGIHAIYSQGEVEALADKYRADENLSLREIEEIQFFLDTEDVIFAGYL